MAGDAKTGKWIKTYVPYGIVALTCTQCKNKVILENHRRFTLPKECPSCKAQMKGMVSVEEYSGKNLIITKEGEVIEKCKR